MVHQLGHARREHGRCQGSVKLSVSSCVAFFWFWKTDGTHVIKVIPLTIHRFFHFLAVDHLVGCSGSFSAQSTTYFCAGSTACWPPGWPCGAPLLDPLLDRVLDRVLGPALDPVLARGVEALLSEACLVASSRFSLLAPLRADLTGAAASSELLTSFSILPGLS